MSRVLSVASVNVNGIRAAVRRGMPAWPAVKAEIDRAPSYAERWSDHAPVVAVYDL